MESSYVFMLREGSGSLEVQYNEQGGNDGGLYLAEAQINITGEHINGGCYFDVDNVEDMDKLISYLTELRGKIAKHYGKQANAKVEKLIVNGLSEDGLCMALGCFNPRQPMKKYCDVHTPYVGMVK